MTPKPFGAKPLYVQLRDALLARVAAGQWKPGDAIPNEIEIAREYGLSAGTVRKSLDWMEAARIIVRRQGRGTFVCDPSSEEFVNWYERLRDAEGLPVIDAIGESKVSEAEADSWECARLHLAPGSVVRRTQRVRTEGGVPYLLERSTVPVALFPLPEADRDKDYPLLELAQICGVILGKGEERISTQLAGPELAEGLECGEDEPLLRLDRIVYTITGQPAKWRVGHCKLNGKYYSASIGPDSQGNI